MGRLEQAKKRLGAPERAQEEDHHGEGAFSNVKVVCPNWEGGGTGSRCVALLSFETSRCKESAPVKRHSLHMVVDKV